MAKPKKPGKPGKPKLPEKASKTPSFVLELPLVTDSEARHILGSRFEAGRQIYNACLGEALKRRDLMQRSKLYRAALDMPSSTSKERKARSKSFGTARRQYGFSEYALHSYVKEICNSWLREHIDSFTAQKLATRAFNAVNKTIIGDAEKVHFKRPGELDSLEGKSNRAGIRWRDGWVLWTGLELRALINFKDKVIAHGLTCRVKYVRIKRKVIRGKVRYYVQLICEGKPCQKDKNKVITGKVGLDLGPSTIAEVNNTGAKLDLFCRELDSTQQEIRVTQRKLDRQRRANNPDNYNPDGTVKKGRSKWHSSRRYLKTRSQLANLHRRQAAHRRSLHGKLVNDILRHGNTIYLEKVSYKGWQKLFGKSINYRAPGMFVAELTRKAEAAGGSVTEFPTRGTALSQMCQCGRKAKKKLSTRWHNCSCGVSVQRDLYSAFLARHVKEDETGKYYLDTDSAVNEWPSVKPLLTSAITATLESYRYVKPTSFGL